MRCSPEFNKQMLYEFCDEINIGSRSIYKRMQNLSWAFTKFDWAEWTGKGVLGGKRYIVWDGVRLVL